LLFVISMKFYWYNMLNQEVEVVRCNREFVITVIVITEFDCISWTSPIEFCSEKLFWYFLFQILEKAEPLFFILHHFFAHRLSWKISSRQFHQCFTRAFFVQNQNEKLLSRFVWLCKFLAPKYWRERRA